MGRPLIALPTRSGWLVEWETGKIKQFHRKDGTVYKTVNVKGSFETTNYDMALQKKAEKEQEGFMNVKIYECMF